MGWLTVWSLNLGPLINARTHTHTHVFDSQVTAAIVTCGGLCPGLNDVTAGIVNKLSDYGVPEGRILGIKYGFRWVRQMPGSVCIFCVIV
jgi:hypothetical protein